MADNSTIGVNLGGLITTSGALNSDVLQALANYIVAQGFTFPPEPLPKSALPAAANVFVTLADDPVASITGGVNTGGNDATITGGQANSGVFAQGTAVDYTGPAHVVFVSGGSGSVDDNGTAASVVALDGTYTVSGAAGDTFLLGGATADVTALSGGTGTATLEGGVTYFGGTSDTITATAGTSTVIGETGDVYTGNAASVLFVGIGTANTVFGGTGVDTVYGDGTTYFAGSDSNVFAGNTASAAADSASTVFAGASGDTTVQAGLHGDLVYLEGAADRVVSGGGKDTIWGSAAGGIAPTIFGVTNSYELLVSGMKGGLAIGLGDNTTLDGANTTGGLTYFANPGLGNQTFIGSATGNDSFYIGTQNVGTSLIQVSDWHKGDTLNLSAFGSADQANALKVLGGGGSLIKLTDGTTVSFVGNHPTGGSGGFLT